MLTNKSFKIIKRFFSGKIDYLNKGEELKTKLENFNDKEKLIVDFYADWCGPCKQINPVLEEIVKTEDINVLKINIDNHQELAGQFNVTSIPYFLFIEKNDLVSNHVGMLSKDDILKKFVEKSN